MTFRFIDEHRDQWPVRQLCQTLEVSPAGYYAWRDRSSSAQQQRQDALLVEIRAIHAEAWAPNITGQHGLEALQHVVDALKAAEASGLGRDAIIKTLKKLGNSAAGLK